MAAFSHVDNQGQASMVNTTPKTPTHRIALAQSIVHLGTEVFQALSEQQFTTGKGSIFQTAIIAGIMAAKKTGELIPLCHPIGLDHCHITIQTNDKDEVIIQCKAEVTAKTGIEMEALVGASLAALTIYDMCKALSHHICIRETRLLSKTGGKNDFTYAVD